MAHQESPLVKRLTFRLPVELYLTAMDIAEKRNMQGVGDLIRQLLDEEAKRSPITKEKADAIRQEIDRLVDEGK
jgi:hypothetical protein